MLEPSSYLDFLEKSLRTEGINQLLTQELDGNEPTVLEIDCEVDRGHPAATEFPLDHVAVT